MFQGLDIGRLNVYLVQDSNPSDLGAAIWSKEGHQGWNPLIIDCLLLFAPVELFFVIKFILSMFTS